jgi:hypothetical protein
MDQLLQGSAQSIVGGKEPGIIKMVILCLMLVVIGFVIWLSIKYPPGSILGWISYTLVSVIGIVTIVLLVGSSLIMSIGSIIT